MRPVPQPHPVRVLPPAILSAVLLAVASGAMAPPAAAQSTWLDTSGKGAVQLEILKPFFEEGTDLTFATSAWYLNGSYRVGDLACLRAELPFAHSGVEGNNEGGTILGNPYAGLRVGKPTGPAQMDLGVRFPLAPEDEELTELVGLLTDVERLGAFLPDLWTLHAVATMRSGTPPAGGAYLEARLGPELEFGTSGGSAWWGLWALGVGIRNPSLRVRGEFNGNTSLDNLDEGFTDASFTQFALGADFCKGAWRPGVTVRLPLNDNLSGALNAVIGINLQYVAP